MLSIRCIFYKTFIVYSFISTKVCFHEVSDLHFDGSDSPNQLLKLCTECFYDKSIRQNFCMWIFQSNLMWVFFWPESRELYQME